MEGYQTRKTFYQFYLKDYNDLFSEEEHRITKLFLPQFLFYWLKCFSW